MISIIDYGAGNLNSVYKAFTNLGFNAIITSLKKDIQNSNAIILPGVGAFKDAMDNLNNKDLTYCIKENVKNGKPILGICLGMQMFYERSFEDGEYAGLSFLFGDVVRFGEDLKVPHMGWNSLIKEKSDPLGNGIKDNEYVYFVHSYYVKPYNKDDLVFSSNYSVKVPALVRCGNIVGMQFHPEKSGNVGLKLLKNFGELIK